jgi:hypothetical protein
VQWHWKKIPGNKVEDTIWGGLNKDGSPSKVALDTAEFESIFLAEMSTSAKADATEAKLRRPTKTTLLDMKRANNVAIRLSLFKMSSEELCTAVTSLDESKLTAEDFVALATIMPTPDEIKLVQTFAGDVATLDRAEQYFRHVASIPDFETKLNACIFKVEFAKSIANVRSALATVSGAIGEIQGSRKLQKLLETILASGNIINEGTNLGNAAGCTLDSLLKLTDVKAKNSRTTLLHYVVRKVIDQAPELLSVREDELALCDAAVKVPVQAILAEGKRLTDTLKKLADVWGVRPSTVARSARLRQHGAMHSLGQLAACTGDACHRWTVMLLQWTRQRPYHTQARPRLRGKAAPHHRALHHPVRKGRQALRLRKLRRSAPQGCGGALWSTPRRCRAQCFTNGCLALSMQGSKRSAGSRIRSLMDAMSSALTEVNRPPLIRLSPPSPLPGARIAFSHVGAIGMALKLQPALCRRKRRVTSRTHQLRVVTCRPWQVMQQMRAQALRIAQQQPGCLRRRKR